MDKFELLGALILLAISIELGRIVVDCVRFGFRIARWSNQRRQMKALREMWLNSYVSVNDKSLISALAEYRPLIKQTNRADLETPRRLP